MNVLFFVCVVIGFVYYRDFKCAFCCCCCYDSLIVVRWPCVVDIKIQLLANKPHHKARPVELSTCCYSFDQRIFCVCLCQCVSVCLNSVSGYVCFSPVSCRSYRTPSLPTSRQEGRECFILQIELFVMIDSSVCVQPPCYRSSTWNIPVILPKVQVAGYSYTHMHPTYVASNNTVNWRMVGCMVTYTQNLRWDGTSFTWH